MEKKNYLKIGAGIFALFLCAYYWETAAGLLSLAVQAAMPLLIGLATAYMLNILMSFYERHYFPRSAAKRAVERTRRGVCLTAAIVTLAGLLGLLAGLVVPELASAVNFLAAELGPAVERLLASDAAVQLLSPEKRAELAAIDWQASLAQISGFLLSGLSNAAGILASMVSSVFSTIITAFTGCIFSIYLLLSKERIRGQCGRLARAYLPGAWREKAGRVLAVLNQSFHRYIVGQCTEALILGGLCALGMVLLGFPYAGMIGALTGFTALIPIAGAYIGASVGAVMMLTVSPLKAVLFLVFIVVLQQLEGNVIYPRVVGRSIGLPPIWVMAAVTVGGGLIGIGGMLLGVPIASAVYQLLRTEVARREKEKKTQAPEAGRAPTDASLAAPKRQGTGSEGKGEGL